MKKVKRIVYIILYVAFAFVYAFMPKLVLSDGLKVIWGTFNPETFIMMLFVGAYLVAFWILINKLFRN